MHKAESFEYIFPNRWFVYNCSTIVIFFFILLTYLLHGAESFLRSKLVLQLVKKFPAFHGTRRFITTLTSIRHLSLSWASPIQSTHPHPTSWRSVLILSTHLCLGLPNGLFPSGFPTKILYTPISSPIHATCPAHLILFDFITRTISLEQASRMCVFLNISVLQGGLLAPCPTPKLEDHPSSAVRDYLFNLFAATLLIGGRSSICNLRMRNAVMTGTHFNIIAWSFHLVFYFICNVFSYQSFDTLRVVV